MINPFLYLLLFLKASLFSTGGFSNLPSLHQDLIGLGWARDADFSASIAIGQISPGPNGLWVISLGYLTYGPAGAAYALVAITLPPLLVLVIAHAYHRLQNHPWIDGFMRGISLAVLSIFVSVCWTIIRQPEIDLAGWGIAIVAGVAASRRRLPLPLILVAAGLLGYLLYR